MAGNTREKAKQEQKSQITVSVAEFRTILNELLQEQTLEMKREIDLLKQEIRTLKVELKDRDEIKKTNQALLSADVILVKNNEELNSSTETVVELLPNKETTEKQRGPKNPSQRKQQRENKIFGTDMSDKDSFTATERKIWLYVGKCKQNTTEEQIKMYLERKCPEKTFVINKLNSKGFNASFRVGAEIALKDVLYDPSFWPKDILIKQYKFFRRTVGFE